MKPKMDGDTIGAIVFALASLLFVWRYLAADLRHSEIRPIWRQLIIGGGIVIAAKDTAVMTSVGTAVGTVITNVANALPGLMGG